MAAQHAEEGHASRKLRRRLVGHLWLVEDVTRARQTEDSSLSRRRDGLTGPIQPPPLQRRARARVLADASAHGSRLALLFFDLDDFKYILNTTLGHRAGVPADRVAGEWRDRCGQEFQRLGGDGVRDPRARISTRSGVLASDHTLISWVRTVEGPDLRVIQYRIAV